MPLKKARVLRSTRVKYDLYTLYTSLQDMRRELDRMDQNSNGLIARLSTELNGKIQGLGDKVTTLEKAVGKVASIVENNLEDPRYLT